jgi:hypothetical protein
VVAPMTPQRAGGFLLIMFAIAVLMAALTTLVRAHGPAEWIQRGEYKNRVGELCCGENDCGLLSTGAVVRVPGGYQVDAVFAGQNKQGQPFQFPIKGFVRDEDATPSPDGEYWACSWGGMLKCFFVVLPGS